MKAPKQVGARQWSACRSHGGGRAEEARLQLSGDLLSARAFGQPLQQYQSRVQPVAQAQPSQNTKTHDAVVTQKTLTLTLAITVNTHAHIKLSTHTQYNADYSLTHSHPHWVQNAQGGDAASLSCLPPLVVTLQTSCTLTLPLPTKEVNLPFAAYNKPGPNINMHSIDMNRTVLLHMSSTNAST